MYLCRKLCEMRILIILFAVIYSLISRAQIIENPVFDKTDSPQFHIDKIEVTKDSTFVYCTYYADHNSWANISPEAYLEDVSTGEKSVIIKLKGLPFAPEKKRFKYAEKSSVILIFQSINNSNKINLIETPQEKGFNIYGISLTEGNDTIYNNISLVRAQSLWSFAEYYASIQNYEKAIERETQAMYTSKKWFGRLSEHYEHSVGMLGFYNFQIKRYDEAIAYLSKDLQLIKEIAGEKCPGYAITVSALASCYHGKGRIMDALRLYNKALELAKKYRIKDTDIARMLVSTAYVYEDLGDYPKAIQLAEEGLTIKRQNPEEDNLGFSPTLSLLSRLSSYTTPLKAYDYQLEGYNYDLKKYGKTHPLTIKSLSDLGIACANINKYVDALNYTMEALELTRDNPEITNLVIGPILMNIGQIYENLYTMTMYEEAIRYYLLSIKQFEKEKHSPHLANAYTKIARVYAKCSNYEYALNYSRKAIDIFKNSDMNEMKSMNSSQKYLFWKNFHILFDSDFPYYVSQYKNGQAVSELYDLVLYKKSILRNDNYVKESWESIRDSLDNKSIAIEFISFMNLQSKKTELFALTIKKGYDYPHMTKLFDLSQFKDIKESPIPDDEKNQLYSEILWEPIKGETEGVENIYFSATSILHTISIEYLPVNKRNDCNIYRVSTTGLVSQIKQRKRYNSSVLFGGLDYDFTIQQSDTIIPIKRSGFSRLDNTYSEVSEIAELMNKYMISTKVYTGKDGTEKQLKELNNSDIDILHLSTHGMNVRAEDVKRMKEDNNYLFLLEDYDKNFFYVESALSRSFMVLSGGNKLARHLITESLEDDGIITALEISALDFHNVDLVVLSACETAQGAYGDDDDIWGLQRAFKKSGANTILMSLDLVDDEATKILMVEFYKNLMSGKTKHQSLKDAQKYLRSVENGKYNDPKYWASFIMLDGLN